MGYLPPAALAHQKREVEADGSWGAVWRSLRGWLPTLRERSLTALGGGAQLEFRSSLALAFGRVSATLDAVRGHAHVDMLPTGFHLPVIHTALVDGRSPAAAPPDDDDDDDDDDETHPSMLYDLATLDTTTHPHASRAVSAIVDAHEFLDLYQHADPVGRRAFSMAAHPAVPAQMDEVSSSSSSTRLTTPLPRLQTCWSARLGLTTAAHVPRRLATACTLSARMVSTGSRAPTASACRGRCTTPCATPWPGC